MENSFIYFHVKEVVVANFNFIKKSEIFTMSSLALFINTFLKNTSTRVHLHCLNPQKVQNVSDQPT